MKTYRIYISQGYSVRFYGHITRWQKICFWFAGIAVQEVE